MVNTNKHNKYLISTHVSYDKDGNFNYGPPHFIYDYLVDKSIPVYMLSFPLSGKHAIYSNAKKNKKIIGQNTGNVLIDVFQNLYLNYKYLSNKKNSIYIGVNPINGLAGVLLKITGSLKKYIYFSADYADRRFNNIIQNFFYHFLDRVALLFSDEVWSVSTRIQQRRISQGVNPSKCKILPNSPFYMPEMSKVYDGNFDLVIVSHLSKSLNLKPILKSLKKLVIKDNRVCLKIIGSGPEEIFFKAMVKRFGLDSNVKFLGFMDHTSVLTELSKSFIGFALYTNENSWNFYGDSMKAREYLACGLPVIINSIPSTSEDIKKSKTGLVLDTISTSLIYDFVYKCMLDKSYYLKLRDNALKLAKDTDKNKVLSELIFQYD